MDLPALKVKDLKRTQIMAETLKKRAFLIQKFGPFLIKFTANRRQIDNKLTCVKKQQPGTNKLKLYNLL